MTNIPTKKPRLLRNGVPNANYIKWGPTKPFSFFDSNISKPFF